MTVEEKIDKMVNLAESIGFIKKYNTNNTAKISLYYKNSGLWFFEIGNKNYIQVCDYYDNSPSNHLFSIEDNMLEEMDFGYFKKIFTDRFKSDYRKLKIKRLLNDNK